MQLLSVVLWGWNDPQPRVVRLRPGRLNVITGDSKTGKSALLDIVDYCFGREHESVAGERIRQSVSWYGVQLQARDMNLFIGRPRPAPGAATNSQAMLVETAEPALPPYDSLKANTDVSGLRHRLDGLLGIGEHTTLTEEFSLGDPASASTGQAILLCLQKQGIVSDQDFLFHRQGERPVADSLRDTLPYFLGAEPWDQAVRQARAREARRAAEAAANRLRSLEARDAEADADLRAMVEEAFGAGLIDSSVVLSREQAIADLRAAAHRPLVRATDGRDEIGTERRLEIQERQTALRRELRSLIEERAALRAFEADETAYSSAVARQHTSLQSLNLVRGRAAGDPEQCPACGQGLPEPDPTLRQMRDYARSLQAELSGLETNQPRRADAVARVERRITELREQIAASESAVVALRTTPDDRLFAPTRVEEIAFHRGRIHASLARIDDASQAGLDKARQVAETAQRTFERLRALAGETDSDVDVHLVEISQYLTTYAHELDVEHSDRPIALDLKNMTAVVTAESGRLRLNQVGSGENYLGLHVATHLALHRFFVENDRPVPRFLMLDQPSQPYYPEDDPAAANAELPASSSDRIAVTRLYRLLHQFVAEREGNFQIVVSDHVNLRDEIWFQNDLVEIWRDGQALIPDHWRPRTSP